jgi:hypothetical protein
MNEQIFARMVSILFYIGLAISVASFIIGRMTEDQIWEFAAFYGLLLLTFTPFVALSISFFFADKKLRILKLAVILELLFAFYVSFHPFSIGSP